MKLRKPSEIIIKGKTLEQLLDEHAEWLYDPNPLRPIWGDLINADLSYADLEHVNLSRASLHGVNLKNANLTYANLRGADLKNSYLKGSHLDGANLKGTEFNYSNLVNAFLDGAQGDLIEYRKGKILTEDIIGYKVCCRDFYKPKAEKAENEEDKELIVTLKIPRGAIVFSINGSKCRTNRAKVIAIEGADRAYSTFNNMSYYVGDEFNVYNFNCEYNTECGAGIHFFMTREEAFNYIILYFRK